MVNLPESAFYEGVAVDLLFVEAKPEFGDLFTVCGYENPNFPPKTTMFESLGNLGFEQIDDYFGIRADDDQGDDVILWLYPLVGGAVVEHEPGPFEGIRLSFNVLRQPSHRAAKFVEVVRQMATKLPVRVRDAARGEVVPASALIPHLTANVETITSHWKQQGIRCGSKEALDIDY